MHPRDVPGSCSYAPRPRLSSRLLARQRQRVVRVCAASSLYEVLGVASSATDKDIKRAYRQKALKLHPDVNKAPNAEAQFLEVKNAFTVLSDPQQRAQYDRKLKGFGGGLGGDFGGFGSWGSTAGTSSSSSAGSSRPRTKQQEEEFYGLEDFFNDLEKEYNSWAAKRPSGKPASLWEELSAIGEEFVDFLETGLGDEYRTGSAGAGSANGKGKEGSSEGGSASFNASSSSSSGGGRPKSPVDAYEQLKRRYDLYDEANSSGGKKAAAGSSTGTSAGRGSSGSSSKASAAAAAAPPKQKSRDEEVEDELAALKKKLGKL